MVQYLSICRSMNCSGILKYLWAMALKFSAAGAA